MPTHAGPNTKGEENLVFGYDLGDVSNSYKGEPTTNEYTTSITDGYAGGGNPTTLLSGEPDAFGGNTPVYRKTGKIRLGVTNGTDIGTLYYGKTYTVSIYLRFAPGYATWTGGEFDICDRANSRSYVGGLGDNMSYEWKRFSVTALHDNNSNYHFIDIGHYNNSSVVYDWCLPQIEENPHMTPYVAAGTTRSATQGLIDLTGNSTIDLSNVSFDSNAQMIFDNTNDYIQLASDARGTVFDTQTFTIETVIYPTVDPDTSASPIWSNDFTSHTGVLYAQHLRLGGASGYNNELGFYWNNGSAFKGMTIDNVIPTLNKHYYIVATYQSGYQAVYVNGELLSSMTEVGTITYYNQEVWIGRSNFGAYFGGDIPLLKFYNRALTASEIKANYNALKGRFNI